jgi:hypothetical protein
MDVRPPTPFKEEVMACPRLLRNLLLVLGTGVTIFAGSPRASAFDFGLGCNYGSCCKTEFCCPTFNYCLPKAPKLCYHCVCPKPICDPCDWGENHGYYGTCWRPWMGKPDWCHCPVPPPVTLAPTHNPELQPADPEEMLPPPNKTPR